MDFLNVDKYIPDMIDYFSRNTNIIMAVIFGSYGTEYQLPESDIDIGILYEMAPSMNDELTLEADISEILHTDRIDMVNLNKAPITLQFKALQGSIIYEGDYIKCSDFIEHVLNIYQDYSIDMYFFNKEYFGSMEDYLKGIEKNDTQ